jgi:uncharacterized protein
LRQSLSFMPAKDKIVLGTVQFGLDYGINNTSGKPDRATVKSILDHAFNNGITLLDTAEAYGDSHEVIGHYHTSSPHKFDVITKFAHNRTDLPDDLQARVRKDLETLGIDMLYAYMFHSYGDFKKYIGKYRNDIGSLKKANVIGKFGVSVYTNEEAFELLDTGEVDLIQLPFNLLDNVAQRGGVLSRAKERNVEVHTRSAFLQGLFFKGLTEMPSGLQPLVPFLQRIQEVAASAAIDLPRLSLSYPLQQGGIDRVLIGVDNVKQLQKNLDSIGELSDQVVDEINAINVTDPSLLNPSTWKNL